MLSISDVRTAPDLLLETLVGETLVYNGSDHACYRLNSSASLILEACQRQWSEAETCHRLKLDPSEGRLVIHHYLAELLEGGLLLTSQPPGIARRQFLQRAVVGSALLPGVIGMVVPNASAAASLGGPLRGVWNPTTAIAFNDFTNGVLRFTSDYSVNNESPTDDVPANTIVVSMTIPTGFNTPTLVAADWTVIPSGDPTIFVIQYGPVLKATASSTPATVEFSLTSKPVQTNQQSVATIVAPGFVTIDATLDIVYNT